MTNTIRFQFQGPWDKWKHNIFGMLNVFEDYANMTNDACDGETRSFDAMVLLTGTARAFGGNATGYAQTGAVCDM